MARAMRQMVSYSKALVEEGIMDRFDFEKTIVPLHRRVIELQVDSHVKP
jgi:hypothetical protein